MCRSCYWPTFVIRVCVRVHSSRRIKNGKSTGIKGVIMVTPFRPGPVKKGSEFPDRGAASKRNIYVTSDEVR